MKLKTSASNLAGSAGISVFKEKRYGIIKRFRTNKNQRRQPGHCEGMEQARAGGLVRRFALRMVQHTVAIAAAA